jgi:hypothetical protein
MDPLRQPCGFPLRRAPLTVAAEWSLQWQPNVKSGPGKTGSMRRVERLVIEAGCEHTAGAGLRACRADS